MFELAGKKLLITDTILRDAHQSLAATRMRTSDMLPACSFLDSTGYWSIECWGGATFDACLRYLDEDPWERLRFLKKALPNTKLQMLLRGQNLLGYRHYADDVVDAFCKKSIENGIDIIRVFDALNDVRNLKTAILSTKKYNGTVEAALCYTISPIHNEDYFINKAIELESLGADIICIKDMANLLLPTVAYSLVKKLKKAVKIPIHLHTHDTSGTGSMVYFAAIQAGVDIVDCALSPFAGGASQPSTEALVASLSGTSRDTNLCFDSLEKASHHFKNVASRLISEGYISEKVLRTDPNALVNQVPGGMLSNLIAQLKNMNAEDKLEAVLNEIPIVRADFGYPPLVTPTSQIIGAQAVINVINGRYKSFTKEAKDLLQGKYGKTPGKINNDVQKLALGEEEIITCRPADLIEPEMGNIKMKFGTLCKSEEDLLSCALFPQIATNYILKRDLVKTREIIVEWNKNN